MAMAMAREQRKTMNCCFPVSPTVQAENILVCRCRLRLARRSAGSGDPQTFSPTTNKQSTPSPIHSIPSPRYPIFTVYNPSILLQNTNAITSQLPPVSAAVPKGYLHANYQPRRSLPSTHRAGKLEPTLHASIGPAQHSSPNHAPMCRQLPQPRAQPHLS